MSILIRTATIQDAEKTFRILRDAFNSYIIFTPYISDKSINLIKRDIFNQSKDIGYYKIWRVLEVENILSGFYCLNINEDNLFLNYIGVDSNKRKMGLGNYQLNDMFNFALINKKKKINLEVFKSNIIALNWYKKNGFVLKMSRYVYLLKNMYKKKNGNISLCINLEKLRESLFEEQKVGCARISLSYLGENIEIGLLGDNYIRILNQNFNLELIEVLFMYFQRNYLILSSEKELDDKINFEKKEEMCLMQKDL